MADKVFRQTLSTGAALAVTGAIALSPVTITDQRHAVVATPRVVTVDVTPTGLFQDLRLITDGAREAARTPTCCTGITPWSAIFSWHRSRP